jgi:hypothetical protein
MEGKLTHKHFISTQGKKYNKNHRHFFAQTGFEFATRVLAVEECTAAD